MANTAVVIIDMLNTCDHQDADEPAPSGEQALPTVVRPLISGFFCARSRSVQRA
ncbi:hypothetical protein Snoj_34430 [Streptomyces nojiriensis]|uniref:Isochorismatase n=1 Tax=Streptomyces nojiriensis TaxID=66374 RepID=A0ABQ3SNY4_9ACTN|nr:hypothetical protein [Streptomyces nojiriensis]QTI43090.1 hypothetical protein JYK04_00852 [Streptomyces nojiriensis]GGS30835.1 hypothetical protein GCM10010205_71340 [Streptomyces nojiriensis]GHI69525.1 hypothetical protein Snoj_34430 [Streptomyces nojiriensis]